MFNKKIILLPILPILLVTANSCGGQKMSDEEYFKNHFNPVVRFIVTSDLHISSTSSPEKDSGAKKFMSQY